jgi:hypothetical protein
VGLTFRGAKATDSHPGCFSVSALQVILIGMRDRVVTINETTQSRSLEVVGDVNPHTNGVIVTQLRGSQSS